MDEDNKTGYGCFVTFIAGVALLISFVSLLQWDDWSSKVSPASFVVSVLSVLVTLLVGWQIYNAIEVKSILSKFNKLERDFKKSNEALRIQDERNLSLMKAFYCRNITSSHSNNTIRYIAALMAIKHFIDADADPNYPPFRNLIGFLNRILHDIERDSAEHIEQFNRRETTCENIYEEIIGTINNRTNELREIAQQIRHIRRNRIRIHNMPINNHQP